VILKQGAVARGIEPLATALVPVFVMLARIDGGGASGGDIFAERKMRVSVA
jgi:hypothetical protein